MPSSGTSFDRVSWTHGQNFGGNLSVKKVKYLLQNSAEIMSIELKNQILRDYTGCYGYGEYGSSGSVKQLILNDGTSASKCSNSRTPNPYCTSPKLTASGEFFPGSSQANSIARFRDSCISILNSPYFTSWENALTAFYFKNSSTRISVNMRVYGLKSESGILNFKLGIASENRPKITYVDASNSEKVSNPFAWYVSGTKSYSVSNEYVDINVEDYKFYESFFLNSNVKSLKGTIDSDPVSNNNLITNKGIYLYDPKDGTNQKWICFQGDGQLEVTVKYSPSTIQFSNTSIYTAQQTVGSRTTYTFSSNQISGGSPGNYYFDFDMSKIKLVSAKISCSVPTTTLSVGDSVTKTVVDAIDFTSGNKTSKNVLAGTSTHILTTTISGSTSNGLYKVKLTGDTTISLAVGGRLKLTLYPASSDAAIRFKKGASDSEGDRHTISGRMEIEVPSEYLLPDSSDSTGNKRILTFRIWNVYILNAVLTEATFL